MVIHPLSKFFDLRSIEPNMVANANLALAREIENFRDFEIVLSEVTTRNDANGDAIKTVNRRLKQFCRQNGWKLISHANITQIGLNKGGYIWIGEVMTHYIEIL